MDKMHFTSEIASEPDKVELTHNGFVSSRIDFALELYFPERRNSGNTSGAFRNAARICWFITIVLSG